LADKSAIADIMSRWANTTELVMASLKAAGKYLLGVLILAIIFNLLAGFSLPQSAALILLTAFVLYGVRTSIGIPVWILQPYRIHIQPRWDKILLDLELVASVEEYDRLCETLSSVNSDRYSAFRDGVLFTVLE
jgi:hypothetical protein